MRLLVSSRFGLSIVDTKTNEVKKFVKGAFPKHWSPYGLTWNEELLFVAIREGDGAGVQRIVVYDKKLGTRVGEVLDEKLFNDLHQIHWHDKKLWVVSSGTNSVVIIDAEGNSEIWNPTPDKPKKAGKEGHPKSNWNHFNSIWFEKSQVYLVAHNFNRPSEVWVYRYPSLKQIECYKMGNKAHNVCRFDGRLTTLSSGDGEIVSTLETLVGGLGFVRGLAVGEKIYIGDGEDCTDRTERHQKKNGNILIFDGDFKFRRSIPVNKGEIYEIRILDGKDKAHNNIPYY